MSVCVAGVVILQFSFAYNSFVVQKSLFERQANDAFAIAFDSVKHDRQEHILKDFRALVSDTGFVKISCRVNPVYGTTVFTMSEVKPPFKGQTQISLSIDDFTQQVNAITPKATKIFIDHVVNNARNDLKNGNVFYYTQKLGDSLSKAQFETPYDTVRLRNHFQKELLRRDLPIKFALSTNKSRESFHTTPINLSLKTNADPIFLSASFADPDSFIIGRLKWILAGSFAMFLITVSCFGYTLNVMLSQQKLSAIKDNFIRNMTHELHTPIASLTVTAEALRKFDHDETTRKDYLDIILLQARRLGALTSEILETARVGSIRNVNKQEINVEDLVQHAVATFPSSEIRFENPVEAIKIPGIETDLLRMLTNLIDNGLKYNPNQDRHVHIATYENGPHLIFEIRDNGPGIADQEKTRIFDPFYRISNGNRHDVKGYGLGLHFVSQVVKSHGGKIVVVDNVPTGATFKITLPK